MSVIELGTIINRGTGETNFTYFREISCIKKTLQGFPGGAVVENLPANAGDTGSSPGLGGSRMPRSD